ncbi:hypothetical protein CE91St45_34110 [Oscillospiraceae bacterium]|nr:hypothetical protein CE91St45_34110 [Oscillospiraceae bacterium]
MHRDLPAAAHKQVDEVERLPLDLRLARVGVDEKEHPPVVHVAASFCGNQIHPYYTQNTRALQPGGKAATPGCRAYQSRSGCGKIKKTVKGKIDKIRQRRDGHG